MRNEVTEEQRKEAEAVLYRYYMQWVQSTALDLAEQVMRGEIEDRDELGQRMEEQTDGALIYTHDQRMVIATSESVGDGEERMEDIGGGGENPLAVLAVMTFQVDVLGALDRLGLGDDFDAEEWIQEASQGEHGEELAVAWDKFQERK